MTEPVKAIIFDMDGTLANTARVYELALVDMVNSYLSNPPSREELLRHFGTPTPKILAHFAPPELVDPMMAAWPDYILRYQEYITLFPGVRETLESFRKAGIRMGIVTSQTNSECAIIRTAAGLDDYIEVWVNSEMVVRPKPNPDPVLLALEKLGIAPENAIMVGDSFNDLEAGQRAGARIAAAMWGALYPDRLLSYNPQFVLQRVEDMLAMLN